jgi:CO/xanthine dehydrogenase FAD-binding subunit
VAITVRTFEKFGDAAAAVMSDRGARFLAGGTLVMRAVNEGDVAITTIVRTSDPALTQIRPAGARIELGAGVTMAQILANRDLAFLHPAARIVGGPAVRNMATVGGNLFAHAPYGDFTAALLALGATVSVSGGYSAGDTPLAEFLSARDRSGTRGLVASVAFPRPAAPEAFRFRKVSRVKPKGVAVLSIAALLPVAGGRIAGARVAYNGLSPAPMRARGVERALEGRSLDEAGVAPAIAVCAEGISPADDAIASAWYRREILPVHLKRLLLGQA